MKNATILYWVIGVLVIIGLIFYFYPSGGENGDANEQNNELGYTDISVQEAKDLIDNNPDLVIIDVSSSYNEGHLPGAVNYYPNSVLLEMTYILDKTAMYLVYCHADSPSMVAAETLVAAGFENVYRLEGNYNSWVAVGYEIEK